MKYDIKWDDFNFVLDNVKKDGYNLYYASSNLKNNYFIVLHAVSNNPGALYYASNNMKNNFNIVLTAVKNYGSVLAYIDNDLKNNTEIISAAVQNNIFVLECVSDKFKKNRKNFLNICNYNINKKKYKYDICVYRLLSSIKNIDFKIYNMNKIINIKHILIYF